MNFKPIEWWICLFVCLCFEEEEEKIILKFDESISAATLGLMWNS